MVRRGRSTRRKTGGLETLLEELETKVARKNIQKEVSERLSIEREGTIFSSAVQLLNADLFSFALLFESYLEDAIFVGGLQWFRIHFLWQW